jgi:transcriptional regulator with XRE-family HTH domain
MPDVRRELNALSRGERIRIYRMRRGMSRERLAGLAGVSPSWLKQVERGTRKADNLRLLIGVAEALRLPVWDLIPGPRHLAPDGESLSGGVLRLAAALLPQVFATTAEAAPELTSLHAELATVWRLRDAAHYDDAASRLAVLLPVIDVALRQHNHTNLEHEALRLYAEAHWAAAYGLFRAGERGEAAWIAADRFVQVARRLEDPLLLAASARCIGHVLLHVGRPEAAQSVLGQALKSLYHDRDTATRSDLSMWGSLLLASALAAARLGDGLASRTLLREAAEVAGRVGEADEYHTGFGPTNVQIHAVSAAVELGDFGQAISQGRQIDAVNLPSGLLGRRAQVHLDMAVAYEQQRRDESAMLRLHAAEEVAPELIRNSAAARELVRSMLRRPGGRTIPGLLDLAQRVAALAD